MKRKPQEEIDKIIELYNSGLSATKVGKIVGLCHSTVEKHFFMVTVILLTIVCCAPKSEGMVFVAAAKKAVIAGAKAEVRDPRIPGLAYRLKRTVRAEINYHWGLDQEGTVFYAQIHQESCWNPEARSVYASGLAQFTPETAQWISRLYPRDLGDKNPLDVRWAIRACVIYDKRLYDSLNETEADRDRWGMVLSSYNGGAGNLKKDKKMCFEAPCCCDQFKWFGHVEHFSNRATWAFKENRDYVTKILDRWIPMYRKGGF